MMTKHVGLFLFSAFVLGSLAANAQTGSSAAMPLIELVGTNRVTLGPISSYEHKRFEFTFRNPGDIPVKITKLTATCACVRGYPENVEIPPKKESKVTLELNPLLVHGTFKRGLWVSTTDPRNKQILLTVEGAILPPFNGCPDSPLVFRQGEPGAAWTNTFTVTANETNYYLGVPVIQDGGNMPASISLVTNKADKMSYAVTLIVRPQSTGRNNANFEIPVLGAPGLPPLRLLVQGRIGTELNVSPRQIAFASPDQGGVFRFVVRTDEKQLDPFAVRTGEKQLDPKLLTFSPAIDGITADVKASTKRRFSLLVTLSFTPQAVKTLHQQKDAAITFDYPKYKGSRIPVVFAKAGAEVPEAR